MDNDEDDDFFGSQDDDDDNGGGGGLAQQEAQAVAQQHRTLGFHETFTTSQEASLQEGFNRGYMETYAKAKAIGAKLGQQAGWTQLVLASPPTIRSAMEEESSEGQLRSAGATQVYLQMAQITRKELQENGEEGGSELRVLEELDRKLEELVSTAPGAANPSSSS